RFVASLVGSVALAACAAAQSVTLLNVSYDPTRELYREFNEAFVKHWKKTTGQTVTVQMSHGGSGSQARAVIDGLQADVVTLALAYDIDSIVEHAKLLPADWQTRLPENSAPYTSTLAFLVRNGNPKNKRDRNEHDSPCDDVITPNPKTSGVARWNYLAVSGYSLRSELGNDFVSIVNGPSRANRGRQAGARAKEFVKKIYANV